MTEQPMGPERERVGRERFEAFVAAQGRIHAECMSLTLSMGFAPHSGYSDDALEAIDRDCRDLVDAATSLAGLARAIAGQWREQRIAEEARQP